MNDLYWENNWFNIKSLRIFWRAFRLHVKKVKGLCAGWHHNCQIISHFCGEQTCRENWTVSSWALQLKRHVTDRTTPFMMCQLWLRKPTVSVWEMERNSKSQKSICFSIWSWPLLSFLSACGSWPSVMARRTFGVRPPTTISMKNTVLFQMMIFFHLISRSNRNLFQVCTSILPLLTQNSVLLMIWPIRYAN